MDNESDRVNSPSVISKVDEQLKEIQRIRDVNNSNIIEINNIRKLEKELEEYEAQIKSKQLQLNRVIDQNNRQKSSIQQKHKVVRKLAKEVEKRDKILELCHNHGNNGEENSEVFLDYSNGHRTFEFRNGEKILFTIKTERLSSLPFFEKTPKETVNETEIALHREPKFEKEIKNAQKEEEAKVVEQKQSNENSPTKELLQNLFEELPIYKGEETNDSLAKTTTEKDNEEKIQTNQKDESLLLLPVSQDENSQQQQQEITLQQQSELEQYNQYYQQQYQYQYDLHAYYAQLQQYYQTLPTINSGVNEKSSSSSPKISNESQNSPVFSGTSENMMNIPEIFRWNFGSSECPELTKNPIALRFWFDEENSHMTKFLLKLHGSNDRVWNENKYVLLEQVGLKRPTTHFLKCKVMVEKLEKTLELEKGNVRIWLDVKSFNWIFNSPKDILSPEILSKVTHFSFGKRTEGKQSLQSHLLLEFLLEYLDNLEFACINNQELWNKSFRQPNVQKSGREEMKNLKTLLFVHEFWSFPDNFISTILKLSPNLENIFNLPLHHVQEMSASVKSLYIRRDIYSEKDTAVFTFVNHLSFLHGLSQWNQWNFLQELDCRVYFLNCDPINLDICCQWLSQIIMMHTQSLRLIKLQPVNSNSLALSQTTMENLTTLHFHLTRRFDESLVSFFPLGFYPTLFPKLSTVGIILKYGVRAIQKCSPEMLFWKHFPSTIFYPGVSFNSVTSLKLHGFNIVSCMKNIAELFPNLQILRLQDELKEVCAVLPGCYGFWPRLKQLHLIVNADTRYRNLDAPLLGTNEQVCQNLREKSKIIQQEEIQKLANFSISQLKELELLKIVVRSAVNPGDADGNQLPILTEIGARVLSQVNSHGRLKVHVAFDESVEAIDKIRE